MIVNPSNKIKLFSIFTFIFLLVLTNLPTHVNAQYCYPYPECDTTVVMVSVSPDTIEPGQQISISGRVSCPIYPPIDPPVYLYLDDEYIGTTNTDDNGYYSFTYSTRSSIGTNQYHTIKAVSTATGCIEGSGSDTFFVTQPPATCNLQLIEKRVKDTELFVGDDIEVFIKLRMDFKNIYDPTTDVTIEVERISFDPFQTKTQTKTFSFPHSGSTDSDWFVFDTDGWERGNYNVYVKARTWNDCDNIPRILVDSINLKKIPEFEIDVYNVDTDPSSLERGDSVEISGKIKFVDGPSGSHTVKVEWFIDENRKTRETLSMRAGGVVSLSRVFDTGDLSTDEYHIAKIRATVDSESDEDSEGFFVEDEREEIRIRDFDVEPSSICQNRDTVVELSVSVTLEGGNDDPELTAKFYVDDNGHWVFINEESAWFNRGQTKTLSVFYTYDAYDLSTGTHRVKVVVKNDDSEVKYSSLRVRNCVPPIEPDIDVGYVSLNPEFPYMGDIVLASTPIKLKKSPHLPDDVMVKVRMDGKLISTSEFTFYHLETKTYQFTIDTTDYYRGTHSLEVSATVNDVTDTSRRTFTIEPTTVYPPITGPDHCLSVDRIWVDPEFKPGEESDIHVKVINCGRKVEYSIQAKLDALDKTYQDGRFTLNPEESKEVVFKIRVPDDLSGVETISVTTWSSTATDTWSKDFAIFTGVPLIDIEPEYKVKECKVQQISFDVLNTGEVTDTFTITVEGEAAEWISGIPDKITLNPKERKTIEPFVAVPCDIEGGLYQFTITVEGSPRYSVTSSLRVVESFRFPTGLFGEVSDWLPWILFLLVLVMLVLFLLWVLFGYGRYRRNGRGKPESCMGPHGC